MTAIAVLAAGELGYVVLSASDHAAPGCDAEAVRLQVLRLLRGASGVQGAAAVEVAQIEEIDMRRSGGITVERECTAEAAVDDATSTVLYEIRPDDRTDDYRVELSGL